MDEDSGGGINFEAVFEQRGTLWAKIPALSSELLELKLEGVETGGIWFQTQQLNDLVLAVMGQPSLEGTVILFVPYSAIQYAAVVGEGVSLSTRKLGL